MPHGRGYGDMGGPEGLRYAMAEHPRGGDVYLDGRGGGVDVIAVEAQARLQTQRVTRTQACHPHPNAHTSAWTQAPLPVPLQWSLWLPESLTSLFCSSMSVRACASFHDTEISNPSSPVYPQRVMRMP